MSLLMTFTAVVAGAVAIWGSVLCCKVMCCGAPATVAPVYCFTMFLIVTAEVLLLLGTIFQIIQDVDFSRFMKCS